MVHGTWVHGTWLLSTGYMSTGVQGTWVHGTLVKGAWYMGTWYMVTWVHGSVDAVENIFSSYESRCFQRENFLQVTNLKQWRRDVNVF